MLKRSPIGAKSNLELPQNSVPECIKQLDRLHVERFEPKSFFDVPLTDSMQSERFRGKAEKFGRAASHIIVTADGPNGPDYRVEVVGENLAVDPGSLYRLRSYLVFSGEFLLRQAGLQTIDAELVNDERFNKTVGGEIPRPQDIDDLFFIATQLA